MTDTKTWPVGNKNLKVNMPSSFGRTLTGNGVYGSDSDTTEMRQAQLANIESVPYTRARNTLVSDKIVAKKVQVDGVGSNPLNMKPRSWPPAPGVLAAGQDEIAIAAFHPIYSVNSDIWRKHGKYSF